MRPEITVRQFEGKQLLGIARHHALVTDRTVEDGGTDVGFTSGELFLTAIGSCAIGSLRTFFEQLETPGEGMCAEVFFEPAAGGGRGRIVIALRFDPALLEAGAGAIAAAVAAGGVTQRVKLGSEIEVRFAPPLREKGSRVPAAESHQEKK